MSEAVFLTTGARRCPRCGTALPADAPEGLCPRCLLQGGLGGETGPEPGRFDVPSPEQLGGLFPQLEILELLGQGGMGAVYKARQPGLDRVVALKVLPPEAGRDPAFAERFAREARALAKLNHPNVVTVYDFGQADGLYYFLMEYVDGINLRQALRAGQLKPAEALKIVPQICDALQYAHDEGVVHRDIKPENILLDKRGRVKITDFGLAKLLGRVPADVNLTGPQQVMGTLHYMAPEQMERPLEVDHRADIYSLGVVFYEMLTGELPLGRFPPPSQKIQLDVRLDDVVFRALEKQPERRYQHASDVKTDVESIYGMPASVQRRFGYEYRSRASLFGLPLVHIATGIDPRTGRKRVAKGIIAYGDVAIGVLAIGGVAFGGIAIGGVAVGLVSLGGLAIGLLAAFGGFAFGGFTYGGGAVGLIAIGGAAVGYYAYGGGAWGIHGYGGNVQDPAAEAFFEPWVGTWMNYATTVFLAVPAVILLVWLVIFTRNFMREREADVD
jgi:tRNA A-37 threonylcarbamoyl transferase component Bud32